MPATDDAAPAASSSAGRRATPATGADDSVAVQALTRRLEQLEAALAAPAVAKRRGRRAPQRRKPARASASAESYAAHAAPFVVRQTGAHDGVRRYVVRISDRLLTVAATAQSTQHRALADAVAERDALVSAARCAIVLGAGRYPKLVAR